MDRQTGHFYNPLPATWQGIKQGRHFICFYNNKKSAVGGVRTQDLKFKLKAAANGYLTVPFVHYHSTE